MRYSFCHFVALLYLDVSNGNPLARAPSASGIHSCTPSRPRVRGGAFYIRQMNVLGTEARDERGHYSIFLVSASYFIPPVFAPLSRPCLFSGPCALHNASIALCHLLLPLIYSCIIARPQKKSILDEKSIKSLWKYCQGDFRSYVVHIPS